MRCGMGKGLLQRTHKSLCKPRFLPQAGHFITGVWFSARYDSNPARLKIPARRTQKISIAHEVRLAKLCQNVKAITAKVMSRLNGALRGRDLFMIPNTAEMGTASEEEKFVM